MARDAPPGIDQTLDRDSLMRDLIVMRVVLGLLRFQEWQINGSLEGFLRRHMKQDSDIRAIYQIRVRTSNRDFLDDRGAKHARQDVIR